jgi:hypothetical protein
VTRRGDDVPRPNPWRVRAADRTAGANWDTLVATQPEAADRAWVALTSEPRRTDQRQHQLKGSLATASVAGRHLEQWQYEQTGAGRIWYCIDDTDHTIWLRQVSLGHPKQTEKRRR